MAGKRMQSTTVKKTKLRCGDRVIVTAGKDRGRSGLVTRIVIKKRKFRTDRLVAFVEGVNIKKKCRKANPNTNTEGGIFDQEAAVDISNLAYLNASTNKADRIGFKTLEDGKKVRFTKSDNEVIGG